MVIKIKLPITELYCHCNTTIVWNDYSYIHITLPSFIFDCFWLNIRKFLEKKVLLKFSLWHFKDFYHAPKWKVMNILNLKDIGREMRKIYFRPLTNSSRKKKHIKVNIKISFFRFTRLTTRNMSKCHIIFVVCLKHFLCLKKKFAY